MGTSFEEYSNAKNQGNNDGIANLYNSEFAQELFKRIEELIKTNIIKDENRIDKKDLENIKSSFESFIRELGLGNEGTRNFVNDRSREVRQNIELGNKVSAEDATGYLAKSFQEEVTKSLNVALIGKGKSRLNVTEGITDKGKNIIADFSKPEKYDIKADLEDIKDILKSLSDDIASYVGDEDTEDVKEAKEKKNRKSFVEMLVNALMASKFIGGAIKDGSKMFGYMIAIQLAKYGPIGKFLGMISIAVTQFLPQIVQLLIANWLFNKATNKIVAAVGGASNAGQVAQKTSLLSKMATPMSGVTKATTTQGMTKFVNATEGFSKAVTNLLGKWGPFGQKLLGFASGVSKFVGILGRFSVVLGVVFGALDMFKGIGMIGKGNKDGWSKTIGGLVQIAGNILIAINPIAGIIVTAVGLIISNWKEITGFIKNNWKTIEKILGFISPIFGIFSLIRKIWENSPWGKKEQNNTNNNLTNITNTTPTYIESKGDKVQLVNTNDQWTLVDNDKRRTYLGEDNMVHYKYNEPLVNKPKYQGYIKNMTSSFGGVPSLYATNEEGTYIEPSQIGIALAGTAFNKTKGKTKSSHSCLFGVDNVLDEVYGYGVTGPRRGHAYQKADDLRQKPELFEEITKNYVDKKGKLLTSLLPPGAIVVWNKDKKHSSGHISVASGTGMEMSDFQGQQMTEYGTINGIFYPKDIASGKDYSTTITSTPATQEMEVEEDKKREENLKQLQEDVDKKLKKEQEKKKDSESVSGEKVSYNPPQGTISVPNVQNVTGNETLERMMGISIKGMEGMAFV